MTRVSEFLTNIILPLPLLSEGPTQLDPGLLQAVLADPVLLQAVDPQVITKIDF